MDKDGGLAAYEAQQAEREADHMRRQARIAPIESSEEVSEESTPKPKAKSRAKKTTKS